MRRPALFYGWYIVAAGLILMAYNFGVFTYGFTAFVNPIAATFGWSYAQISLATSLRGAETGALNPMLGMAVDRWPARRLMLIGVIVLGLGVLCLSQVNNLAMFYAGFLIMGLGSSLATSMIPTTLLARWFTKDVGKASGILAMGTGVGGALVPLLVKLIDSYGWQNVLLFLAVGTWVLGIPLSFVFRNRPEDYGLLPDGKPQVASKSSSSSKDYDFSTGIKEALRMRAFWHMGMTMMLQTAAFNAVTVHMMPYLTSLGMKRSSAGTIAMLVPLVTIAGRMPFGLLSDIFVKKYVWAVSLLLMSVGLFLFWFIDGSSFILVLLFAIVFGFGISAFLPMRPGVLREYFGTRSFGAILGFTSIFTTIGMIVGPPLAGWVFDTLGVYDPIWLIFSGCTTMGAIIILAMPRARKSVRHS